MATATAAMADSYTITFKDGGADQDGSVHLNNTTDVTTVIAEGLDYVSGIGGEGNTAAFLGKTGTGVKLGSGKAAGTLTLNLSTLGSVKADKIVVNAAAYSATEKAPATINGKVLAENGLTSTEYADYEVTFDSEAITTLVLSGTEKGRYYVKSLTVYYTPVSEVFDAAIAHAPRYSAGLPFEVVLGPDLIGTGTKTNAETGEAQSKPCIAEKYQWVEYVNPTSTLDNGAAEVQQSSRWTNFDPNYADYNYGEGDNWIQVTGNNGSKNCPVLSSAWGKYMVFYVKETAKVSILGIGSASGSADDNNCLKVVAVASDNSDVVEVSSTPGAIYGKGTASDTVSVILDPTKAYMITVKGDETAQKDIQLGSLQLFGTSEVPGAAAKATNATYAYWDVVTGPDMIVKGGTKVKTNAETGEVQDKYGVKDELAWITYVNPTSVLDDGTAEVQTAVRWTDLDPITGKKGDWIQVAGEDGDVNAPVLSPDWGKYMLFQVTGTKKFTVYGAGSASGSADDQNCLKVTATPYNSNAAIEATSTPGGIYGKGSASDLVSVELDETETYEIKVEAAVKDIQVLGINLQDAAGIANEEAGKGTLNIAVEAAAQDAVIDLGGKAWTLNGIAAVERKNLTIQNGTIVADEAGQLSTKNSLVLDGIKMEATVTPIVMAAPETLTAADTLALYTFTPDENGEYSIAKYENASNKVFEAQLIAIKNSTIKTGASMVSGGKAPWALRTLLVDNSVVETYAKSGKAFINWEEGASQIKDIVIQNSTLYGDSLNTEQRFHRYSAQVDPWRVWGYQGDDKNAPGLNTWTLTNNTIVNLCGNKEFSNNIKNTAATTFTFTGNIFANTWRLQKLGSNVTRNFEASDNVICGGVNTVDGTDASKWATEDANMGVTVEHLSPCPYSLTAQLQYGDPKNLVEFIDLKEAEYQANTETSGSWVLEAVFTAADSVVVAEEAAIDIYTAESLIALAEEENEEVGDGVEEPVAPTPVLTLTAEMITVEGNTVTVNIPAAAEELLTAGTYVVVVPEGTFTLYGAADAREHGVASEATTFEFTVEAPVGIETLATESNNAVMYNVAGQRVNSAKGFVIMNGKVFMAK